MASLAMSTQACRSFSNTTAGRTSDEISSSGRWTIRADRPARSAARTNNSGVSPRSGMGRPAASASDDSRFAEQSCDMDQARQKRIARATCVRWGFPSLDECGCLHSYGRADG